MTGVPSTDENDSMCSNSKRKTSDENVSDEIDDYENWGGMGVPKTISTKNVKQRRSQLSILNPQVT